MEVSWNHDSQCLKTCLQCTCSYPSPPKKLVIVRELISKFKIKYYFPWRPSFETFLTGFILTKSVKPFEWILIKAKFRTIFSKTYSQVTKSRREGELNSNFRKIYYPFQLITTPSNCHFLWKTYAPTWLLTFPFYGSNNKKLARKTISSNNIIVTINTPILSQRSSFLSLKLHWLKMGQMDRIK